MRKLDDVPRETREGPMIIILKSGCLGDPLREDWNKDEELEQWHTQDKAEPRAHLQNLKFWLERESTGCLMTGSLTNASPAETIKTVKPQSKIFLRMNLRVLKPWLPVGTTATFRKEGRLSLWPNTVGWHLVEFNTKISIHEAYESGEGFVISVGRGEYRRCFQSKALLKQRKHGGVH